MSEDLQYKNMSDNATGFAAERPNTGNFAVDACGFEHYDTARLVELLWSAKGTNITENDFIRSLPFLFRMYNINEQYWVV